MYRNKYFVETNVVPTEERFPGGRPVCPAGSMGYRIDAPTNGTYNFGGGFIFTVITIDEKYFNWQSNLPGVLQVVAKGGTNQNVYVYDGTVLSDTGLVSPLNRGGNVPQLSHIDVCFKPGNGCPPDYQLDCNSVCFNPDTQKPPNIFDCKGICYPREETPPHVLDCKGVCHPSNEPPANVFDCAGNCGGDNFFDCGGNCVAPCHNCTNKLKGKYTTYLPRNIRK